MKKVIKSLFQKLNLKYENPESLIQARNKWAQKNFNPKSELARTILADSHLILKEIASYGISFKLIEEIDDVLLVEFNNLKFYIESSEDIFILKEVFIDQDYNFIGEVPTVVLDIGLNIGVSSVFFSQKENITKIYSFEPITHTFELAVKNLNINKCNKVTPHNYGLGGHTREEVFYFNKKYKGNSGVRGELSYAIRNSEEQDKTKVKVLIKGISDVISNLNIDNEMRTLAKIDCEGAEYEIIEELNKSGNLKRIDAFIIEWHDKGAKEIEDILKNNGYSMFSRRLETNSGLIYAYQ